MSKYPFDHIITKLRTTRGSVFARSVMDDAADEIERLQYKIDRVEDLARRAGAGFAFPEEQIVTVRAIHAALGGEE